MEFWIIADKPELDKTPSKLKAASNIGDSGKLYCRASAIPKPNFKWLRSGSAIAVNTTNKYYIEFHEVCIRNGVVVAVLVRLLEELIFGKRLELQI